MSLAKMFILKDNGGLWIDPAVLMLKSPEWMEHISNETGINKIRSDTYEIVLFDAIHDNPKSLLDTSVDSLPAVVLAFERSELMVRLVNNLVKLHR